MFTPADYFNLTNEPLAFLFNDCDYVWDALKRIASEQRLMTSSSNRGTIHPTAVISGPVYIGEGARIGPHVHIEGPTYIGAGSEVRHGAYIRSNTVISENCLVGHDTEVKGSIMLSGSQAPHFAYVGDSILGQNVNLGAGTKLANFKLQGGYITIRHEGMEYPTELRKFGAIIGDGCSIGCNTVTAPGTLIGKESWIYSLISLRGVIPAQSIVKPQSGYLVEPMVK